MLDTFGPLEMFAMTNKILEAAGQVPAFKLTLVSEDKRTSSFGGPVFESDVVGASARRQGLPELRLQNFRPSFLCLALFISF